MKVNENELKNIIRKVVMESMGEGCCEDLGGFGYKGCYDENGLFKEGFYVCVETDYNNTTHGGKVAVFITNNEEDTLAADECSEGYIEDGPFKTYDEARRAAIKLCDENEGWKFRPSQDEEEGMMYSEHGNKSISYGDNGKLSMAAQGEFEDLPLNFSPQEFAQNPETFASKKAMQESEIRKIVTESVERVVENKGFLSESVKKNIDKSVKKYLKEDIDEYQIGNTNYDFQTDGNYFGGDAYRNKMNYDKLGYRYNKNNPLNYNNYNNKKGNSWTSKMIQRGNNNGMTLIEEFEKLTQKILQYEKNGNFGQDQTILRIVYAFCTVMKYTANRLQANINKYDNRRNQTQLAPTGTDNVAKPVTEAQTSVYGLQNGIDWIIELTNEINGLKSAGCFTGTKSTRIVDEFLELLRLADETAPMVPVKGTNGQEGQQKDLAGSFNNIGGKMKDPNKNKRKRWLLPFVALLAAAGLGAMVQQCNGNQTQAPVTPNAPIEQTATQQQETFVVNFANNSTQLNMQEINTILQDIQDGDVLDLYHQGNIVNCSDAYQIRLDVGESGQGDSGSRVGNIKEAIANTGKQVKVNVHYDIKSRSNWDQQAKTKVVVTHANGGQQGGSTYQLQEFIKKSVDKAMKKYLG